MKYTLILSLFHPIVGGALGLLWLSRAMDFAVGIGKIADLSAPKWDIAAGDSSSPVTVVVPATVAPSAGAVTDVVGGVVSGTGDPSSSVKLRGKPDAASSFTH